jgi:4,5-DOPA dioxygenase extradiol
MPKPGSVLMISAHWEERPTTLGATRPVPLVHDFYGFPAKYYQTKYPSPGAPELATRVRDLLARKGMPCAGDPQRGLDHGAYVPLVAMYPAAHIPVLQMSMPALVPEELFALGQALAPLRDEGVLIFGSGFLTHNMRYAFQPGTPAWARDFDAWVADALARLDVEALKDFQARAPAARTALPTWEHYAPVLVAAGAVADARPKVAFPIAGCGWTAPSPSARSSSASPNAGHVRRMNRENQRNRAGESWFCPGFPDLSLFLSASGSLFLLVFPLSDRHCG